MEIGSKIHKLMGEQGISQESLANSLEVSQKTIHDIVSGKTKKIDFLFMQKVCDYFQVDLYYFLEKPKLKQVNKDSSVGYIAENQNFYLSEKLIEQYEIRIKELKEEIQELKNQLKSKI